MYRYTPNKTLLKSLRLAREKPYGPKGSADWNLAKEHFSDYRMITTFLHYWEHTDFYSKTLLQEVPVNGYLLPLKYFEETKV